MWTLTICLLLLLVVFAAAIVLVTRFLAELTARQSEQAAMVLVATVERLIQPIVAPEPVVQVDVPGQTEMFNEPEWSKDWPPPGPEVPNF